MLGDEVLEFFSHVIEALPGQGGLQLKKFDLSSCRLNDYGLLYLLTALAFNPRVQRVKLNDNFFSETIEASLLEILNKNMHLTEISLQGNRLSHGCLAKIKQITYRNSKLVED